jgi:hypothetical protein
MNEGNARTRSYFAVIEETEDPLDKDGDWLLVDALAEEHFGVAVGGMHAYREKREWDSVVLRCRRTELRARTNRDYGDRAVWYWVLVAATPGEEDVEAEVVLLGDTEGPPVKVGIRAVRAADEGIAQRLSDWAMLRDSTRSVPTLISGLLDIALRNVSYIAVAAYDVGQGNCNAIVDQHEHPRVLFDFGWPPNFHAGTRPARRPELLACDRHTRAPVVLSHWDMDHWAFAVKRSHYDDRNMSSRATWDSNALERFWIARAPRNEQHQLGPMHMGLYEELAAKELFPGLTALQLWPDSERLIRFTCGWLEACEPADGSDGDRNNTGLAMFVEDVVGDLVLLPGDADFPSIGSLAKLRKRKSRLVGLVAPHHGARISAAALPRAKKGSAAMLVYSVGEGNQYDHPKDAAMAAYRNKGWLDHWTSHRAVCSHGHEAHVLGNRLVPFADASVPRCGCECVPRGSLCLSVMAGKAAAASSASTATGASGMTAVSTYVSASA